MNSKEVKEVRSIKMIEKSILLIRKEIAQKNYMEKNNNEENDWDHKMECDLVQFIRWRK